MNGPCYILLENVHVMGSTLPNDFKTPLSDIYVFVVRLCIKAWFGISAINAPNNNLQFLKDFNHIKASNRKFQKKQSQNFLTTYGIYLKK